MTDWGAHHLDIAQWGINSYPVEIKGTAKYPEVGLDSYNVATDFYAEYKYANGVIMTVSDTDVMELCLQALKAVFLLIAVPLAVHLWKR